jgi:hypothetical protein
MVSGSVLYCLCVVLPAGHYSAVQCSDSVYCILCMRCGAAVFYVGALFHETGGLPYEIWVIFFNVTLWNVFL